MNKKNIHLSEIYFDRTKHPHVRDYIQVRHGGKNAAKSKEIFDRITDPSEGYDHSQPRVAVESIEEVINRSDTSEPLREFLNNLPNNPILDPQDPSKIMGYTNTYILVDGNHRVNYAVEAFNSHKKTPVIKGIADYHTKGVWPVEIVKFENVAEKIKFQNERNIHRGMTHSAKDPFRDDAALVVKLMTTSPHLFNTVLVNIHKRYFKPISNCEPSSWIKELSETDSENLQKSLLEYFNQNKTDNTWGRYINKRKLKNGPHFTENGKKLLKKIRELYGLSTSVVRITNTEAQDASKKKFGVEKQKYNLSDGHLAKMLVDQGQRTECYVKHVHPQTLGVCQFTKDYIKAAKEAGLCVVAEGAAGRRIFLEYILVVSDAKSLDRLQLTKFRKDVLDTVKEQNDYARKCHKTEYVTRVMFVAQTQKEIKDFGANCLFDYNNLDEFKNEEI